MSELQKIVVFDLNNTYYIKSSKDEFYKFICTKKPKRVRYFIQMMYYKLLLKLHKVNQTEFKENFFNYLDSLPPNLVEEYAKEFWRKEYPGNFNKELKERFDKLRSEGVKIICATGGLELYVKPLFDLYPIDAFVGTRVEYKNGTYQVIGEACKREEKLRRISALLNNKPYEIIQAFSDSKEDILDKAAEAFLVKNEKLIPYKK